ncbi:glycosyltransferase [Mycobacterium colombiense]|uniref:glycosyltransferase n=1 Tax=Mycobacterium colombiense TaxID=339268 RepID=UPI00096EE4F6|nr:glycosyltransferase [Mycobacterium colombiense]OMC26111.1 sugar transferase [Mycobacterium colombiense]
MTNVSPTSAPKVSVVSITYNHEAFIRDTLEGFVAQKTDFPIEIVIADDASTDATAAIIQDYADRFPHLFRPILRSANVGIHANLTDALSAATGEYLAICEGDDYWTDPTKLSRQVAFLDQHPEVSLCFHPVRVLWTDGRKGSEFPPAGWRRDLTVDALIRRNFIQTNSVLYRRQSRYDDIPADVMPMDWYLHVRHAADGGIAMLPETMAVYRRHPESFWYGADVDRAKFWVAHGRGHAAMFEAMLDLFPGDPAREEIVAGRVDWILREIARVSGPEARAALLEAIAQHPRSAMLALQHRWRSPPQRLRALRRRVLPLRRTR